MDIYVGSLPFKLKDAGLKELFEAYGEVSSAKIVIDKITRQNKGFGFVEMPNDEEALAAIQALNESELDGRKLIVNKSVPKYKTSVKDTKPKKNGGYFKGIGNGPKKDKRGGNSW
ncbi:RNA recognition motif domain-containing protein [Flectobacillus major]|jgi:RNA recognition motif-containing protein|uniref:RNA recognition motif domain-containing protein n=1 Tax=Flectobacillus major TaxID=103 RepID=UPI0003F5A6B3|nr:hypothetical protein [Flectobacillus major]